MTTLCTSYLRMSRQQRLDILLIDPSGATVTRNYVTQQMKERLKKAPRMDVEIEEPSVRGHRRKSPTDTADCTGRISGTKCQIMHDCTRHLLSALSGEVFVTHLQNDPLCMASWE